jgi:hypothetical protein
MSLLFLFIKYAILLRIALQKVAQDVGGKDVRAPEPG